GEEDGGARLERLPGPGSEREPELEVELAVAEHLDDARARFAGQDPSTRDRDAAQADEGPLGIAARRRRPDAAGGELEELQGVAALAAAGDHEPGLVLRAFGRDVDDVAECTRAVRLDAATAVERVELESEQGERAHRASRTVGHPHATVRVDGDPGRLGASAADPAEREPGA